MGLRFRAREFHCWSRREFMVRAVRAMMQDGKFPASYQAQARASFQRLAEEDRRLRRLLS
jgi:hypothetical protein